MFRQRSDRNASYGAGMSTDTVTDFPWEPPLAGTETEHIVGALDRLRTTFRWKVGGLDAAGLATTVGASTLTLGGLLKHLAHCEAGIFNAKFRGLPLGEPWDSAPADDEDWDFHSAAADGPEELYALYDAAVARSQEVLAAAIADGGLQQPAYVSGPDGRHANLCRLVCDLVEEYGRHTGHADLLREAVDGLVGEDPPARWTP